MEIEETAKSNRGKYRNRRSPSDKEREEWLKKLEEMKEEIGRGNKDE